jgi:hypothetical protein
MSAAVESRGPCDRCDRHLIFVKQWQWLCGDCEQLLGVSRSASQGFDLSLRIATGTEVLTEVR